MTHILIVANRSIVGETLADAVRERLGDDVSFHLLVPVGNPVTGAVAIGAAAADMTPTACFDFETERESAQARLDKGLAWLAERGATATGRLTAETDIAAAVAAAVEEHGYDEVIVSTLASAVSRWLRQDLPHRVERKLRERDLAVPVTVVTPS